MLTSGQSSPMIGRGVEHAPARGATTTVGGVRVPVVARREAVAEIKRWREHRSKLDAAFMAAICASDRELETRLDAFLGTLSEADRELLLREKRERQPS